MSFRHEPIKDLIQRSKSRQKETDLYPKSLSDGCFKRDWLIKFSPLQHLSPFGPKQQQHIFGQVPSEGAKIIPSIFKSNTFELFRSFKRMTLPGVSEKGRDWSRERQVMPLNILRHYPSSLQVTMTVYLESKDRLMPWGYIRFSFSFLIPAKKHKKQQNLSTA